MAEAVSLDRNLALDAVRVTESAARAASRLTGLGDEMAADQAAVDAMRRALNALDIDGTVVIGEGERDEAPMLQSTLLHLESLLARDSLSGPAPPGPPSVRC